MQAVGKASEALVRSLSERAENSCIGTTVYVAKSSCPDDANTITLQDILQPVGGPIKSCLRVGDCYRVDFAKPEGAEAAIKMSGQLDYNGSSISVTRKRPPPPMTNVDFGSTFMAGLGLAPPPMPSMAGGMVMGLGLGAAKPAMSLIRSRPVKDAINGPCNTIYMPFVTAVLQTEASLTTLLSTFEGFVRVKLSPNKNMGFQVFAGYDTVEHATLAREQLDGTMLQGTQEVMVCGYATMPMVPPPVVVAAPIIAPSFVGLGCMAGVMPGMNPAALAALNPALRMAVMAQMRAAGNGLALTNNPMHRPNAPQPAAIALPGLPLAAQAALQAARTRAAEAQSACANGKDDDSSSSDSSSDSSDEEEKRKKRRKKKRKKRSSGGRRRSSSRDRDRDRDRGRRGRDSDRRRRRSRSRSRDRGRTKRRERDSSRRRRSRS